MNGINQLMFMSFLELTRDNKKLFLILWFILAIGCLWVNYVSGPNIQFPILFVLPVLLASWFNAKYWGYFYAITLPLAQFYFFVEWQVGLNLVIVGMNTMVRITVLLITAFLTTLASEREYYKSRVNQLEGLLPICTSCKKIRDESKSWQPLEKYIMERSDATFTHGVCPECMQTLYGKYKTTQ